MNATKLIRYLKLPVLVFLLQFFTSDLLSIKGIRPDFVFIFILYNGIRNGSFSGVINGFLLGMVTDLAGVSTYFGLSAMLYATTGYLSGFLKGQYSRIHPFIFHTGWVFLSCFVFFISSFVKFHVLFETDFPGFLSIWIYTLAYTLGIIGFLQPLIPVRER